MKKILIYGVGNIGREDDGLGIYFIQELEKYHNSHFLLESNYQLNVEDCLLFEEVSMAIFVDASLNGGKDDSYFFSEIFPQDEVHFSTHGMSPQSLLAFSQQYYNLSPPSFLLEICGQNWKFQEGLSLLGQRNLDCSLKFFNEWISKF